jgi:nucleoside permease NupC
VSGERDAVYRRHMKAILQATLAAILSGALVGWLLKKKLEDGAARS